jgi:anti-sigma B factor antagonist
MLDQPISQASQSYERLPVLVVKGEIDLAVAPSLRQGLTELLDAGHSSIVVDLIEASFLDSIALGVLVGALEQCRAAGGDLHLLVTEPRILRVLEITGLLTTFSVHGSRDELSSQDTRDAPADRLREVSPQ